MLASSAHEQELTFDVIPKIRRTTSTDDHFFKAEGSCDRAKRGGRTSGGCFRRRLQRGLGILVGRVTRDRNSGIFETRGQVGLRTPDRLQGEGWQAPRPWSVGTPAGASFFRPFADAVLPDEISTRTSPDSPAACLLSRRKESRH